MKSDTVLRSARRKADIPVKVKELSGQRLLQVKLVNPMHVRPWFGDVFYNSEDEDASSDKYSLVFRKRKFKFNFKKLYLLESDWFVSPDDEEEEEIPVIAAAAEEEEEDEEESQSEFVEQRPGSSSYEESEKLSDMPVFLRHISGDTHWLDYDKKRFSFQFWADTEHNAIFLKKIRIRLVRGQ
jgi:hypothetical protein